jgi:hypothetical protein
LGVITAIIVAQIDKGESLSTNNIAIEEAALGSIVDNKARDINKSKKTLENT